MSSFCRQLCLQPWPAAGGRDLYRFIGSVEISNGLGSALEPGSRGEHTDEQLAQPWGLDLNTARREIVAVAAELTVGVNVEATLVEDDLRLEVAFERAAVACACYHAQMSMGS